MSGSNVAIGNSFIATVDVLKGVLGNDERWITVSGISATLAKEPREEGGNAAFTRFVTKGLSYSDLVLTRAVDEKSRLLVDWFAGHIYAILPGTGSVKILKPDGKVMHTYTFHNMVPINYKGPDLGMDKGTSVVTESVTFAHHGFADKLNGSAGGNGAASRM
jgi:phage tail-like protein